MSASKIVFNNRPNKYWFLSNDFISDIVIDNKLYTHVEGYVQAAKYISTDEKVAEHLRFISSPMMCRKASDKYTMNEEMLTKWNDGYKIVVMKRAVYTKFITNEDLAKKLIATNNKELVYEDSIDSYWGTGPDKKGSNFLGKILEEVRDVINDLNVIEENNE